MPPLIKCPNCQQNEWLESSELNYLPRVSKMIDGKYGAPKPAETKQSRSFRSMLVNS